MKVDAGANMLIFKKMELEDIGTVRPYFSYATNRFCDYSVGGTVMWRNTFNIHYTIYKETLVMRQSYISDALYFVPPVGKNPEEALEQVRLWCVDRGIPLRLCVLSEEDLERLPNKDLWKVHETEHWGDYLYPAEQLATLKGRSLAGQRNHINYFVKTWPDYRTERIDDNNISGVKDLLDKYRREISKDSPLFTDEIAGDEEVLNNYESYGFLGLCLIAGGRVVAYAMGEVVGDTLHVHVEKADRTCRGAYQMMVREFARTYAVDGVMYINREDDSGDEGLRRSKLSYHPSEILKKYTAEYQGDKPLL
jgi:hypothetical protein